MNRIDEEGSTNDQIYVCKYLDSLLMNLKGGSLVVIARKRSARLPPYSAGISSPVFAVLPRHNQRRKDSH